MQRELIDPVTQQGDPKVKIKPKKYILKCNGESSVSGAVVSGPLVVSEYGESMGA